MNAVKNWTISIISTAGMAAAFYAWHFLGHEGAGNILGFYLWFLVVIGFIHAASTLSDTFKPEPVAPLRRAFGVARMILIVAVSIAFGHFWLGSLFLTASILSMAFVAAARTRLEKTTAQ